MMKNICFQISNIEKSGGTERVCLMIANALSQQGYNVHVMSWGRTCQTFFPKSEGVCITAMRTNAVLYRLRYKKWLTCWLIRRFVKRKHIDVMIDVDTVLSNETIPALRGTQCKHVAWDHYNYYFCQQEERRVSALNLIKSNSDAMVVLTKADRLLYVDKEGVEPSKIHQIYNPLTFELDKCMLHLQHKVLAVGRFSSEKGFDLLLQAWKIVESQVSDWTLEIWGDTGNDTGDVYATFERLSLQRASLHPATSDIRTKFESAGIFVLSSRFEGLGIVLLEACAAGLPIVSFDCPNGPNEIVEDGVNGYLVEAENIEKLADAIINMIHDDEGRARMGQNAFEMSQRFSLEKIVNQWQDLIESL